MSADATAVDLDSLNQDQLVEHVLSLQQTLSDLTARVEKVERDNSGACGG